jgi:hypothetical protein
MSDVLTAWGSLLFVGKWLFVGLVYLALLIILAAVRQEARWRLPAGESGPLAGGRLRVLAGDGRLRPGFIIPLRPVNTLGAEKDNTLALADPYVSAHHARLTWDGSEWWVEDLDSSNGTRVDQRPCQPHARCPVAFGARLALGNVVLELLP